MTELEQEGYKWIYGQKPTELDLYQPADDKDYYITVEGDVINHIQKDSIIKEKVETKEPTREPIKEPEEEQAVEISEDLELLRTLLSKEEFRGYLKGSLINNIGKNEEQKQHLLTILRSDLNGAGE